MSTFKDSLKIIALSLIVLSLISVVYAWTEPGQSPPLGNLSAPITISSDNQTKSGNLVVNSLGTANGLIVQNGNVGIGTVSPSYKLDVAGQIRSSNGGFVFPDNTMQTSAASGGIPTGAIMFFNLSSCPSGWSEATSARGRYIVGLPSGGTLAGTDGTALSNLEDRPVGQHAHGVNDPGHAHSISRHFTSGGSDYGFDWVQTYTDYYTSTVTATGVSIQNTGTAGTNAPYIQFLTCQKN